MANLTRRNFLAVAAAAAAMTLAGCAGEPEAEGAPQKDAPQGNEAGADAAPAGAGATLVAYFSATGNTAGIAQALVDHLGADAFRIEVAEPYTDDDLDYNDGGSRVGVERAEDGRPELAQVTPDGWGDYDTVLLGYPIWWGDAAGPAKTFAEGNDFDGKTVVPFCTSASSGIGRSGERLAELAGAGDWREGERFSAGAADEAANWADGLGL
ncbi:flavodoxin [Thermophilibacter sp.]